jgi:UDP-glucose 6-dehydrogenase
MIKYVSNVSLKITFANELFCKNMGVDSHGVIVFSRGCKLNISPAC